MWGNWEDPLSCSWRQLRHRVLTCPDLTVLLKHSLKLLVQRKSKGWFILQSHILSEIWSISILLSSVDNNSVLCQKWRFTLYNTFIWCSTITYPIVLKKVHLTSCCWFCCLNPHHPCFLNCHELIKVHLPDKMLQETNLLPTMTEDLIGARFIT